MRPPRQCGLNTYSFQGTAHLIYACQHTYLTGTFDCNWQYMGSFFPGHHNTGYPDIYIIIGLVSKTRKQRGLYAYKPVHMCIQVLHIGPGIQAPCCRQNPKQNHDLSTGWGQHNCLIPPASTRLRKKTKNSTGLQAPCFRQIPKQNHDLVTGCSENPNSTGFAYLG